MGKSKSNSNQLGQQVISETVRRHQTRSKAVEFGVDEMREWWKEKDYWDFIKETIITEDKSKDEIIIQNQDALWKKPE